MHKKKKEALKMRKSYNELQACEMLDVLWLHQASEQLQQQQCYQLADYFQQLANSKLQTMMHIVELPKMSVETILREATHLYENNDDSFCFDCGCDKTKIQAIINHHKKVYLHLISLLHDCVEQKPIMKYRCLQCGYESDCLDDCCPLCHASQGYFLKRD